MAMGATSVAALRLVAGRRPWATAIALVAGPIELGVGGWFAYALGAGLIPLTDPAYVTWPLVVMVSIISLGVGFVAAALSERVMDRFRRWGL